MTRRRPGNEAPGKGYERPTTSGAKLAAMSCRSLTSRGGKGASFRTEGRTKKLRFPLETKHLVIRSFVPEDAKEIHKIYADLELMHRITSSPSKSLQDTYRLLARLTEHQQELGFSLWAMIEKESGRIIGDCGLFLVEGCWPEVEFTYHLDRPYWCKGYAKEATAECLRFGFEQLKFERIIAVLKPDDPVSAQMLDAMEKNGMSYMGTGWFHDQEMFIYAAFKQRLVLG